MPGNESWATRGQEWCKSIQGIVSPGSRTLNLHEPMLLCEPQTVLVRDRRRASLLADLTGDVIDIGAGDGLESTRFDGDADGTNAVLLRSLARHRAAAA